MFKKWYAIEFVAVRRDLKASPSAKKTKKTKKNRTKSEGRDAELNKLD